MSSNVAAFFVLKNMHYTKTKINSTNIARVSMEGRKGKGKRRGCHLSLHGYSPEQTTNI